MRKKEPCFLSFPAARPVSPQSSAFLLLSRTFLFDSQHAPTFYIPPRRAPRSYGTACRRPAADDFVKTRCAPNFPPRTLERKKNRFLVGRRGGGNKTKLCQEKSKKNVNRRKFSHRPATKGCNAATPYLSRRGTCSYGYK